MPYPNFHSCRLRNPDDFKDNSFVTVEREHEGKRYEVIRGRLKEDNSWADQAFRYPKNTWTVSEARAHCKAHEGILFEPASEEEDTESEDRCCGAEDLEEKSGLLRRSASRNDRTGNDNDRNDKSLEQIALLNKDWPSYPKDQKITPIRCFEGNAKPHEPFWIFKDLEGEEPEMELDGYISEFSWFDDDITPKMFRDDLEMHGKGGPITIRIHSYGGDVVAASLMNTYLHDYPGKKTVQIDGIAASAATVVAMAGDHIRIQDTAYFMIHDPLVIFFLAMLNIEDLNRMANTLQTIKEGIMNAYETKTGLSRARLSKMMTDETWMDANRAKDLGFVDEIIKGGKKEYASPVENAAVVNALRNYKNVPRNLMEEITNRNIPILSDIERQKAEVLRNTVNQILEKERQT